MNRFRDNKVEYLKYDYNYMELSPKYYLPIAGSLIVLFICFRNYKKRKLPADDEEVQARKPVKNTDPVVLECEKVTELKVLLKEQASEGWDTIKETESLQVYKKIAENSPVAIIKARLVLKDTKVDDAFFAIWDGEFRREWDSVAKDFHVIEKFAEDSDIIYFYAASPMPSLVSNREFVQNRRYVKENDSTYIVYWSADKPERPVPDNWVRANTILSGYCITKVNEGVTVEFISQNDVKGKIPPKLINALAPSKALEWAKKFTKACQMLKEKKDKAV